MATVFVTLPSAYAVESEIPDTFAVALSNSGQFQPSTYTLDFDLSSHAYLALSRGGFEIKFPVGTNLDSISNVAIEDNHPGISYRLDYKEVFDRTLVLNLRPRRNNQTAESAGGPVHVKVSIENIINPTAGTYRLKAKVFDKDNETISGNLKSNEVVIFDTFPLPQYVLGTESLKPDTVLSRVPFALSFDVNYVGLPDPIWLPPDSARITVTLPSIYPGHTLDTIYEGRITHSGVEANTLQYRGIRVQADGPLSGGVSGFRKLQLNYVAFTGGRQNNLQGDSTDSVFFFQYPEISLVSHSLSPDTVNAGTEAALSVDVLVSSDYPVDMVSGLFHLLYFAPEIPNLIDLPYLEEARLFPGANRLDILPIRIPQQAAGQEFRTGCQLLVIPAGYRVGPNDFYFEGYGIRTDSSGNTLTVLGATPTLQLLDLEVVAPNAPRVNIGQAFSLRATVANHSNYSATGVQLKLQSDGDSHFDSIYIAGDIGALDTATFDIPVAASGQASLAEVFRIGIVAGASEILDPINDIATVFIDLPAILEIDYNLFGVQSGFVSPGGRFSLTVELKNNGDAPISDAHFLLTTGLVEFGQNDSITGAITVEENAIFNFDAPLFDTNVFFVFQLIDTPIDLNSGQPAVIQRPAILFPIRVERIEGSVVASASPIGSALFFPATDREYFATTLVNQGQSSNSRVNLRRMFISVRDENGVPLNAESVLDISTTRLIAGGVEVSRASSYGHRLSFVMDELQLVQNGTMEIVLAATPIANGGRNFALSLNVDDIEGVYVSGSLANQRVQIVSLDGTSELFRRLYLFTRKTIAESFRIENNPCNPDESPVRFAYVLESNTDVEFRIFTLGGLEIYAVDFPSGSNGGSEGEHEIEWHGKNREGNSVMNGVYIASIKVMNSGEYVRRKVAIVR